MEPSIIRATPGREKRPLPPATLLLPVPEDFHEFRTQWNARPIRTLFRFMEVRIVSHEGGEIGLAGPFLGAPQGAMLLENLAAMGTRHLVFFGWCGSIREEVRIGDLIVPSRAISDEGTSRHYPLPGVKIRPDPLLRNRILEECGRRGLETREGPVWTTDAPYRETPGKIAWFRRKGALAVEMELSALLKVARFRNVRLAALLVVFDELFSGTWKHGFRDPRFREMREQGIRAAFEACLHAGRSGPSASESRGGPLEPPVGGGPSRTLLNR